MSVIIQKSKQKNLLKLLESCSLELEYMVVNKQTLDLVSTGALLNTRVQIDVHASLRGEIQNQIQKMNCQLEKQDACLMPGIVHPWSEELSVRKRGMCMKFHFSLDEEGARLYAALRALEPLFPAFFASTPFRKAAFAEKMSASIEMARLQLFPKMIELSITDVQECPEVDLAIAHAILFLLQEMLEERWSDFEKVNCIEGPVLEKLYQKAIVQGEKSIIEDQEYLRLFGYTGTIKTQELLKQLLSSYEVEPALYLILKEGPLARRLLNTFQKQPSKERLQALYRMLVHSLQDGAFFTYGTSVYGS